MGEANQLDRIEDIKARKALDKKAAFGQDIDFSQYREKAENYDYPEHLADLDPEDKEQMLQVGVDVNQGQRAGTFVQMDHSVIHCQATQEGIELLSTSEAQERYPWLANYWWRALNVDADKYTARAELHQEHGYFIRALPGVKAIFPLQACLYIGQESLEQDVHNIVIAEEGSELHIISGCATGAHVTAGLHIGVSEFYVKRGAKVTFTMIHNWGEQVAVRPRTGTIVEEGGVFLSNYVSMNPVRDLQMYPTTYLEGPGAIARYHTIVVAPKGSNLDVGSRVVLRAPDTRAEIIARTLTTGGTIINRGCLVGETPGVKAHLECRGLMLGEGGIIQAIPELLAKAPNLDLSHEAAVGKIAPEEIEYLMARGLSEEQATAVIVRGFLNVQITGLPPHLQSQIDRAIASSQEKGL